MTDSRSSRDEGVDQPVHSQDTGQPTLTVDGLAAYLECPRKFQFAHERSLRTPPDDTAVDRLELLRIAICDGLRWAATTDDAAPDDPEQLIRRMQDRLRTLWEGHSERFHSAVQRRHERRVMEATIEAYVDHCGIDHLEGITSLSTQSTARELIGPTLPVATTVQIGHNVPDEEQSAPDHRSTARLTAEIDYATVDGSTIVGVKLLPTPAHLGLLRYRNRWDGDVEQEFRDHFDSESETFDPGLVSSLFEISVVLGGLRTLRDQLNLDSVRTCRYVQVPLLDRQDRTVNRFRDQISVDIESIDLTDRYLDHHTFGLTHEHRNRTVDDRLQTIAGRAIDAEYEPVPWELIRRESCSDCPYSVCCSDYIEGEVRFDGK
ncbi:PD-(D/E)XK nuclease family protein [Halobacteria archaeon AArc-curdl1]|uniref:PD-(D/E)XK nuclease family protein n=1 Tax=Natronosalvus hydrolyticus TaxID=2979988 RepID=A0AAP3E7K3_9EURY|nr:PD-(D/E)XK nuclease family protein [Halobacteria archaeon AArc-curdl1]